MWGVLGRICIVGGIRADVDSALMWRLQPGYRRAAARGGPVTRIGVTNNDTDNLPTFEHDAANRWRGTAELPGGGWWKLVEVQRGR